MLTLSQLRNFLIGMLMTTMPVTSVAADFTTPQGAVRALEEAYRNQDIEAAIATRDFREEARLLFLRSNPDKAADPESLRQGALIMEVLFREEFNQIAVPSYAALTCVLSEPVRVSESLVKVTERCQSPDGSWSEQNLYVFLGSQGWRVAGIVFE